MAKPGEGASVRSLFAVQVHRSSRVWWAPRVPGDLFLQKPNRRRGLRRWQGLAPSLSIFRALQAWAQTHGELRGRSAWCWGTLIQAHSPKLRRAEVLDHSRIRPEERLGGNGEGDLHISAHTSEYKTLPCRRVCGR